VEVDKMRHNQPGRRLTCSLALGLLLATAGTLTLPPAASAAARPTPPTTVYAITSSSDSALYRLEPGSHVVTLEGRTGAALTDITFQGQTLYAISFTDLYRLDAGTGASHLIGSLGLGTASALVTQPGTNTLYGADLNGNFFKINALTGHATIIGPFGNNLRSAGDLTFANGRLYATVRKSGSPTSFLATVDMSTGAATIIGNTGYSKVWGLVTGTGALFGATDGGEFVAISPITGQGTVTWNESIAAAGLAVPNSMPAAPVVITPLGQIRNQRQDVRIQIGNKITMGVKVFSRHGWYVITGANTYVGTVPPDSSKRWTINNRIIVARPPKLRSPTTPAKPPATPPTTPPATPPTTPPTAPPATPPATPPAAPPTTRAKGAGHIPADHVS
jgi:hypothetical protein